MTSTESRSSAAPLAVSVLPAPTATTDTERPSARHHFIRSSGVQRSHSKGESVTSCSIDLYISFLNFISEHVYGIQVYFSRYGHWNSGDRLFCALGTRKRESSTLSIAIWLLIIWSHYAVRCIDSCYLFLGNAQRRGKRYGEAAHSTRTPS